jgi:PhzF family phenazine biosynthesis protein
MEHRFTQVDVFGSTAGPGNPVAVVHDAHGLTDAEMQAFAHWTNLSETTFLLSPTQPGADYRVRIFTPTVELSFAGHPTLGSAHSWLVGGGVAHAPDVVVQECALGLVPVSVPASHDGRLAFAAPPLVRSGPVDSATMTRVLDALRVAPDRVIGAAWVDNGPGWLGVRLDSAQTVVELEPDFSRFGELEVGVIGEYPMADRARIGADVEVRAFVPSYNVPEDPVTGSLNASLAQWLIGSGELPASYVASQGSCIGRAGRIYVDSWGGDIWVGGATATVISGTVEL